MDIVNIYVYAEGYHSGAAHEENVTITKENYLKLKDDIDNIKIYISDLDGKHSECEAEIGINIFDEEDQTDATFEEPTCDGDQLYYELKDIFDNNEIDFEDEIRIVKEYERMKRSNVDKDLILQCHKCYHKLYISEITLEKFKEILNKECPNCGEEGYENWILFGIGNYERDVK